MATPYSVMGTLKCNGICEQRRHRSAKLDMGFLAKLYPKDDFVDRATAMIADSILMTVLIAGGLYWWLSAQPEHVKDALPQDVTSLRDRGEDLQPAQPIPVHRKFEPGALHRGVGWFTEAVSEESFMRSYARSR